MSNTLIIVITLLLSAFFSGMEIAFISSNKLKLELENKKGNFSARLLRPFLKRPSRLIGALLLGNNIALVIYGMSMTTLLNPIIEGLLPQSLNSDTFALFVKTLISTIIILFFAEFVPKALFRLQPNKILVFFAIPVSLFYYVFYPLISIYLGASEFILKRVFRMNLQKEKLNFSFVDLDDYLKEYNAAESFENPIHHEIQMFQNAIEFRSVKLRECLVPRNEIVAVEENESVEVLKQLFIDSGLSRIILYSHSIDNIIGYVHSSDLFKHPKKIKSICRPLVHLPETMLASKVLPIFVDKKLNIAIVVDEFGGTAGLITIEDVIEEIFGEIEDEFDEEEMIDKKISDNEFIFSCRLEIDYLNEKYNLQLPESNDYETLSGLLLKYQEHIPQKDEKIIIDDYIFTVLLSSDTKVEKVQLIKKAE